MTTGGSTFEPGSHLHFKHPTKSGLVTAPYGGKLSHDAAPSTLRSILRQGTKLKGMNYIVIIELAYEGTFSVYFPDLPGCVSTGSPRDEAIEFVREAIAGHIETLRSLGEPVPPPRSQSQVVAA